MERISTAEAARRLRVSQSAIRRRIAAGQLRAELEPRPQGARFWVLWDESPGTMRDATMTVHDASAEATIDANREARPVDKDALIEWLQRRLERAEEERAELRRLLSAAHQTIAIQAPRRASPDVDETVRDATVAERDASSSQMPRSGPESPERPPARSAPWWRRLFGG